MVLWLHEEEAVDAPYIQAVLAEFEAACETCGVPVPARLRVLALDVALQQGNTSQVHTVLSKGRILSPSGSTATLSPSEHDAGYLAAFL